MDKFSELIKQGVTKFEYKPITGNITDTYPQDLESQMRLPWQRDPADGQVPGRRRCTLSGILRIL